MIKKSYFGVLTILAVYFVPVTAPCQLTVVPFVTNVFQVTDISNCGDNRLFIVERPGTVKVSDLDGNLYPDLFLSIVGRVKLGGEQGLLGMAFSPNYIVDGTFYVNYTNLIGSTIISRFKVLPGNPNVADSLNEEILLTIPQPYNNHNGGAIHFGKDGFLYIGMGDGGAGGDPGDRAQNLQLMLGKMLRIDVSGSNGYTIPETNPFYNSPPADPHIWSIGLRNPWRFSFDNYNGDLWIGDVGQNLWEEVNYQPSSSTGGENYGWRCYEANHEYNVAGCQPASAYVYPVYEYPHSPDCSVTGGYVYRGAKFDNMFGRYFFVDYCSGRIRSLIANDAGSFTYTLHGAYGSNSFTTFGQDRYGELYLGKLSSGVFKLVDSICRPVAFISPADTILHPFNSYLLSTPYNPELTYQWYFNNQPLPSANKSTYLAGISGEYYVSVVKNDSCYNSSGKVMLLLGQQEGFEMYPNPAVDFVEIVWSLNFPGKKILEVIDVTGRLVLRENIKTESISYTLKTHQLAHGVYIIRMIHENTSHARKLVVR